MRRWRLLIFLWLVWLVGCGTAEVTPTARARADQIAIATQVALDTEATQTVRGATQTAQAMPTATATATMPPTPTIPRTPTTRPTATLAPTRTPRLVPTKTAAVVDPSGDGEEVVTDDDLTQPAHAWLKGMPCEPGNLAMVVCHDDAGLHLLFDQPGKWGKVWSQRMLQYSDVRVDLTTRVAENPEGTGGYGILCRYQNNGDGYILRVWADGRYGISRLINGREFILGGSGSTPHPAIATGLAENQLHMECVGDTFVIAVNGQELLRVVDNDPELSRGTVALYGCTCRGGTLDVVFSHVRVVAPQPASSTVPPRAGLTRVSSVSGLGVAPPPVR